MLSTYVAWRPFQADRTTCCQAKSVVILQPGKHCGPRGSNHRSYPASSRRIYRRRTVARCTFVRQTGVCPTKVLALRGRVPLPSRVPLNLDIWKNSTKREKPVTSTRSGSMSSKISVSAGCLRRLDWNTTAAGLSSKESSPKSFARCVTIRLWADK